MRLRKNMIIKIDFDDHVQNCDELMKFTVYGRVAKITRASITIDGWHHINPDQARDHNCEGYTIARKAILKIQELVVKDDESTVETKVPAKKRSAKERKV